MDTAHSVTESDMTELLSLSRGLYRIYIFKTFYDFFCFSFTSRVIKTYACTLQSRFI